MLSTEIQRSVRLNKKKKSTNISPYPDEAIERLARAFYPAILACWNSEEGQREFAAWQAEQAHIATKEKQEVPVGELPALLIVCGFLLEPARYNYQRFLEGSAYRGHAKIVAATAGQDAGLIGAANLALR